MGPNPKGLRDHFPALYVTLVSIVIALAVEGLLGRLDELDLSYDQPGFTLVVLQVVQFVLVASVFWWVSARWVTVVPWPFSLLDGLNSIAQLFVLHYLGRTIGPDFDAWLLALGGYALLASLIYLVNGKRAIRMAGLDARLERQHLYVVCMLAVYALILIVAWFAGPTTEPAGRLGVLVILMAGTLGFGYIEYKLWCRLVAGLD